MYTVELTQSKAKKVKGWFRRFKQVMFPVTHKIVFYDSDRNLPIRRFQKFQKYLMVSVGVGSTYDDYIQRDSKAVQYLGAEDYGSLKQELLNKNQCMWSIYQDYSPKGNALAVMVHSIDGVVYTNFEDGTLDEIQDKLDEIGFTKEGLDRTVDYLKKK